MSDETIDQLREQVAALTRERDEAQKQGDYELQRDHAAIVHWQLEADEAKRQIAAVQTAWTAYEDAVTAAEHTVAHEKLSALLDPPRPSEGVPAAPYSSHHEYGCRYDGDRITEPLPVGCICPSRLAVNYAELTRLARLLVNKLWTSGGQDLLNLRAWLDAHAKEQS